LDKKIVSFGEMLWDVFPNGKIAGGAPMNVALHLHQLNTEVTFISKVGRDQDGQDLLSFLLGYGLPTDHILIDPSLPTGKVIVDDKDKENIRYEIVQPAAWDNINWTETFQNKVDQADAIIFGSLATRSEVSRSTLLKLLHTQTLRVFDINLRSPFYSKEGLQDLLSHADILKLNEEELQILIENHGLPTRPADAIKELSASYNLRMICVTKGKDGADLFAEDLFFSHPGFAVTVEDTVGSGDAFLGALIDGYLKGADYPQILENACALGAMVATKKGGTPKYDVRDIEKIKGK
jgi:fructokinase